MSDDDKQIYTFVVAHTSMHTPPPPFDSLSSA